MSEEQTSGQAKTTVVEEDTQLEGALSARGPVLVMGRVNGDLSGLSIEITETGAIAGRIKTPALHSRGVLSGTIEAEDVELSGRIMNDTVIRAQSLTVELDTAGTTNTVFGDCELEIGEAPVNAQPAGDLPPPRSRPGGGRRRRGGDEE